MNYQNNLIEQEVLYGRSRLQRNQGEEEHWKW